MTDAVLDASVVLKWFRGEGERHADAAHAIRARFEAGELLVFAPPLLFLEIVNVAGRRWRWPAKSVVELASALQSLGFELVDPELEAVARWTASGLSAYDASYVAIAEMLGTSLISDDEEIVRIAQRVTIDLGTIEP